MTIKTSINRNTLFSMFIIRIFLIIKTSKLIIILIELIFIFLNMVSPLIEFIIHIHIQTIDRLIVMIISIIIKITLIITIFIIVVIIFILLNGVIRVFVFYCWLHCCTAVVS
jgi:hypothetical protein